jgi:hypothetical protein
VSKGLKLGLGIPLILLGLFLTLGGLAMVAFVGVDGAFTTPQVTVTSSANAIVFDSILVERDLPVTGDFAATIGIEVTSDKGDVFVGIGPTPDVSRYLRGVAVDRATEVDFPSDELKTTTIPGERRPAAPGEEDFWAAKAEGSGDRSVEWTLDRGDWTLVVMNADGSPGLTIHGAATIEVPALGGVTIGFLVVGIPALAGGIWLVVTAAGSKRVGAASTPAPPGATSPGTRAAPTEDVSPPPPRPDDPGRP